MIAFAVEPLEKCWSEVIELANQHWHETEGYRHGQPFQPLFERYNQYERAGWLLQFTARDEGRLIGYATMYLTPSMHTQQLIATEDTFFLLPDYRKGWNGVRLVKFVEAECARRGAVEITMTAKVTNNAGALMECMRYSFVAKQFSKALQ